MKTLFILLFPALLFAQSKNFTKHKKDFCISLKSSISEKKAKELFLKSNIRKALHLTEKDFNFKDLKQKSIIYNVPICKMLCLNSIKNVNFYDFYNDYKNRIPFKDGANLSAYGDAIPYVNIDDIKNYFEMEKYYIK